MWFWVFWVAFALAGVWWGVYTPAPGRYAVGVWSLVVLILFFILGNAVFGGLVKG